MKLKEDSGDFDPYVNCGIKDNTIHRQALRVHGSLFMVHDDGLDIGEQYFKSVLAGYLGNELHVLPYNRVANRYSSKKTFRIIVKRR